MVSLQAGAGFGGAARDFYDHHRTAVVLIVLSLVGMATGAATAASLLQSVSLADVLLLGAGTLLAGACCAAQTRHLGLAAVAALAPIPGLIWAAPLSGGVSHGAVPIIAYAFGFAIAAIEAQAIVERECGGDGESPWRHALAATALFAMLAMFWFWDQATAGAALQAAADLALAGASALLLVPLSASLLPFDESFVARANRVHERRQRAVEHLARVTVPRWGLSFAGIALVFLALGWFGAEPVMRTAGPVLLLRILSVLLVTIGAAVFVRDWREGIAAALVASVVCLVPLWATNYSARDPFMSVGILEVVAIALLLSLQGARRARAFRTQGDAPALARERAMERLSVAQGFAAAGALAAILPAAVAQPAHIPLAIGLLVAGVGGTVFAPAVGTALDTLLPRRRSADELYRPRKRA